MFSYWKSIFRFECANNLPVPTLSQYTTPVTMDHSIQTSTNMVLLLQLWILLALQSPWLSSLLDFSTPPYSFNHFCILVDVVSTQDCRLHTSVCCTVHLNKLRLTITSWKIPQMVRIVWTQAETTAKAWAPPSKRSPWSEFLPWTGYWFMPKDIANRGVI